MIAPLRSPLTRRAVLALCLSPALLGGAAEKKALSETEKIESLIKHVETLESAKFIRNGSDYDAKTAAKFLRGKWNANSKSIHTAKDFISVAGTKSGTTGKAYAIRLKDGSEVPCGDYLTKQLAKLEDPAK